MARGEIGMMACRLWFCGTHDGEISHGTGFPLPKESGRPQYWLIERPPGQWDLVNSQAGSYRVAFDNAEDAGKWLEEWCRMRRKQVGEAYRAAEMLMQEMTPKLKG